MIIDREVVAAALPGYELGAQLGRGAFGLVLAGRDRLRRDVAIKVLPGVGTAGSDPAAGAEAEALVLASLDHPHVVRVHDYIAAADVSLIVMELLGGGDLRTRSAGRLDVATACAAGLAVAGALGYAHTCGVLHRDVKPENMLFAADGMLKVTDFGIAKALAGTAALASAAVGTPRYMAPEQFLRGELRPATDLYALGAVLYKMLAGRPPFAPGPQAYAVLRHNHLHVPAPPPAGVPAPVAQVVLRALEKDPGDRFRTARDLSLHLARAAADSLGPGWLDRAGLPVRLGDEEIQAAAAGTSGPSRPAVQPVQPPTADPASSSSAITDRYGGASGPASVPPTPDSAGGRESGPAPAPAPRQGIRPLPEKGISDRRRSDGRWDCDGHSGDAASGDDDPPGDTRTRRRMLMLLVAVCVLVVGLPLLIGREHLLFSDPGTPASPPPHGASARPGHLAITPPATPTGAGRSGQASSAAPTAPPGTGAPRNEAAPPMPPVVATREAVSTSPVAGARTATPAPAPAGQPCGVSSGKRNFDARNNYTASTGTISWDYHSFVVSGQVVDTVRYPSTSYAYLHWETNTGSSCDSWTAHETLLATAPDGQKRTLAKTVDLGEGEYIRNVWVRSCTDRNGWACSDWK